MAYRPDPVTWYVVERSSGYGWHRDSPEFERYEDAKRFYEYGTMEISKKLDDFRICVIVKEEVEFLPKRIETA